MSNSDTPKSQTSTPLSSDLDQESDQEEVIELEIDHVQLQQTIEKVVRALQVAVSQGIKRGFYHLPSNEADLLMVATDLIERSQRFPNYKLAFYRYGIRKDANNCAVTFEEIEPKTQPQV